MSIDVTSELMFDPTSNRREQRRTRLASKVAQAAGLEGASDLGIDGPMLRTGEVALLFGVSERCIRNWANDGKLNSVRTLGRHRLFPAREVARVLRDSMIDRSE